MKTLKNSNKFRQIGFQFQISKSGCQEMALAQLNQLQVTQVTIGSYFKDKFERNSSNIINQRPFSETVTL